MSTIGLDWPVLMLHTRVMSRHLVEPSEAQPADESRHTDSTALCYHPRRGSASTRLRLSPVGGSASDSRTFSGFKSV